MDTRPDSDLVRESLTVPDVFGRVFDRHARSVYHYVQRRAGDDVAGDVTSEVFARAFQDRGRFVAESDSALPWLLGIATNLLRMHRRSEDRRLRAYARAAAGTDLTAVGVDVHDRLEAEAARDVLADALGVLPTRRRDVLLLSALGELTPGEIAVALGLRPGTARSELHRARAFVAAQLASRAPHLVPDQDLIP